MKMDSVTLTLCVVAGLAFGFWLSQYMTAYRWMRLRRRIRCVFGQHDPGPVRDAVGGRRIQRCDWCDKIVREYEVTVNEAKRATIRRIY